MDKVLGWRASTLYGVGPSQDSMPALIVASTLFAIKTRGSTLVYSQGQRSRQMTGYLSSSQTGQAKLQTMPSPSASLSFSLLLGWHARNEQGHAASKVAACCMHPTGS